LLIEGLNAVGALFLVLLLAGVEELLSWLSTAPVQYADEVLCEGKWASFAK